MTAIDHASTPRPPLEGRSLRAARFIWFAALALALTIFVAALPGYIAFARNELNPPEAVVLAPASVMILSTVLGAAFSLMTTLTSFVMSWLLFWRGDRSFMVFYTSLYLLGFSIIMTGPLEIAAGHYATTSSLPAAATMIWSIYFSFSTPWLLWIFPNGRYVPGWTRYLIFPTAVLSVLNGITTQGGNQIVSPFDIVSSSILGILLLSGFLLQAYRYFWVSTRAERKQTQWVLIGVVLWLGLAMIAGIDYTTDPAAPITTWRAIGGMLWSLSMSILPLALTVSILRYRLWDVDVIVRRTLTYGSITLLLGFTYFGAVALLQNVFVQITGQQSPLAVVASTLGIAALFNPLRSRVQTFVDRRFYRRKYDAERTLEAFTESLRDEVEIEHLQATLLGVVEETMQPESVSLWIR